jgi:hypothetical protein
MDPVGRFFHSRGRKPAEAPVCRGSRTKNRGFRPRLSRNFGTDALFPKLSGPPLNREIEIEMQRCDDITIDLLAARHDLPPCAAGTSNPFHNRTRG